MSRPFCSFFQKSTLIVNLISLKLFFYKFRKFLYLNHVSFSYKQSLKENSSVYHIFLLFFRVICYPTSPTSFHLSTIKHSTGEKEYLHDHQTTLVYAFHALLLKKKQRNIMAVSFLPYCLILSFFSAISITQASQFSFIYSFTRLFRFCIKRLCILMFCVCLSQVRE